MEESFEVPSTSEDLLTIGQVPPLEKEDNEEEEEDEEQVSYIFV